MNKGLFIKTTDEHTKDELLKCGFTLQSKSNGVYTFLNDKTKDFKFKEQKLCYTNNINV